jgi:hypothetical protein
VSLDSSNSLRHSGQRDARRRRLLTDDLSNADESRCRVWPENAHAAQSSYGNAEFLDRQWRLLDLVPRRLPILMLLLSAGIAIIAGLEAAYSWMLGRAAITGATIAALDIDAKGSLACWFISLTLLAAAVASLLVYTVRRHRRDDYQGRYRIWRWTALCWFIVATDQAASLREGLRDIIVAFGVTPRLSDYTILGVAVYVLLLVAIGSRLLLDMRPSRLSIGALIGAAVAYGLALASWLGWLGTDSRTVEVMFRMGAEMAGALMLLTAMTLHARYVLLDAEGRLPHREAEEADEPDEDELDNEVKVVGPGNRWRAAEPPHTAAPQPAAFQRPATPPTASAASQPFSSTFTPEPINRKLTKGERKALKERLLRERREREAKGL